MSATMLLAGVGCATQHATGWQASARERIDPEAAAEARSLTERGVPYSSSRAYLHYLDGVLALQRGRPNTAIRAFEEALLYDPVSSALQTRLAEANWRAGFHERARKGLRHAVRDDPGYLPAQLLLARYEDRPDLAEAALLAAIDGSPREPRSYRRLASLYLEQGRLEPAQAMVEALAGLVPGDARPWIELGVAFERKDRLVEAEGAYRRACQAAPLDAGSWERLGNLCQRRKVWPCAVEAFQQAAAVHPERAGIHLRLAAVLGEVGDAEGARHAEEVALEAAPQSAQVRIDAALNAYRRGEHPAALARLGEALALEPEDAAQARFYRGWILEDRRDWSEAATAFQEIRPGQTWYFESRLHLSLVLSRLGRHEEALLTLREAEGAGDEARLRYQLGLVLAEAGRGEESLDQMRQVLELEPDHVEALNHLAYALVEGDQDLDEAEAMVRRALRLAPERGHLLDTLGWIQFRRGNAEVALGTLERAAGLAPDEPVVLDHLGDVYAHLGRWKEASAAWQRALRAADAAAQIVLRAALTEKLALAAGR